MVSTARTKTAEICQLFQLCRLELAVTYALTEICLLLVQTADFDRKLIGTSNELMEMVRSMSVQDNNVLLIFFYELKKKKKKNFQQLELLSQHSEQDRHVTQTNMKIDTEVAGLKTMLEAHKLDTIKYLAGKNIKITHLQFKNNFKKLYICQSLQSSSSFFLFHKSGMRLKIIVELNYFMKAQNEAKSTTTTKQNKKKDSASGGLLLQQFV